MGKSDQASFYFLFSKHESFSFSFFLFLGKQVVFHNIKELEPGEMAEQLGATIALSEDLTWFPAPM